MNQNPSQCMMWFLILLLDKILLFPSDRCLMYGIMTVAFGSILDVASYFGIMLIPVNDMAWIDICF